MKKFIIAGLAAAAIFYGCSSNKEYAVKTTVENGVKVITNPEYPKEGVYDLVLEELYTLGTEADNSKYLFANPLFIDLDSHDNLYVMDWDEYSFFVFDNQGKYLRKFGKKGAGPGDFELPSYFKITTDDRLIINDARNLRLCLWTTDGKYIESINYKKFRDNLVLDSHNNCYSTEIDQNADKLTDKPQFIPITRSIIKHDLKENKSTLVGKFSGEKNLMFRSGRGTSGAGPFNAFVWKISQSDKIYTGNVDKYEFVVYDCSGNLISKFSREYKLIPDRNYKEGSGQSRYLRAFSGTSLFDDKSNFWVSLAGPKDADSFTYDVYSEDGVFQKQIISKYRPAIIKGDRIYSVVRSDDAPTYIKAFRYSLKKRDK